MFNTSTYIDPLYSPLGIKYQQAHSGPYQDVSTKNIIAGLKQEELSGFGRPMIDNGEAIKEEIDSLWKISNRMWYRDYFVSGGLSEVSKFLLKHEVKHCPYFTQVIDLTKEGARLHGDMRKSYKHLVNKGKDAYETVIIDKDSPQGKIQDEIQNFRQFHIEIIGRETRPPLTWELQRKQIQADEGFAVFGLKAGDIVAAAFFIYNKISCYYGVSVSAEDINSHWLIWEAIRHAKHKLGCRYFDLGEQQFVGTHKQYNISLFKRGFGGQTKMYLEFKTE